MSRVTILLLVVLSLSICNKFHHVLSFRPSVSRFSTMNRPYYVVKQHHCHNRSINVQKLMSSCAVPPKRPLLSQLLVSVEGDFTTTEELGMTIKNKDQNRIRSFLRAFYKFCRPHTIRGTILASIAGTTRALLDTPGALGRYTPNPSFAMLLSVERYFYFNFSAHSLTIFHVQLPLNGVNCFPGLS